MGEVVVFSNLPPFILSKIEGLGDVEADIQSQKSPYQDGETHIDTLLEPRFIEMEISVVGENIEENRRYLAKVMNPKLSGVLQYENNSIIRVINGVSEHVPKFPSGDDRNQVYQLALVNIKCPNPYWKSLNQQAKPLQAYVGKFKLPMTFPFELGTSGSRATLYNDGDLPAPIEIDINGPITNPQIFNRTTGKFIRINRSISEDEKIIINTESGQKKVSVISSNGTESQAFGYLDAESTLFNLEIGENEIEHVADSGNRHAEVIVRWQNMYVGV